MLLGMVVVFAFHLNRNYDAKSGTLQLLGATLQLGENDSGDNGSGDDEDED